MTFRKKISIFYFFTVSLDNLTFRERFNKVYKRWITSDLFANKLTGRTRNVRNWLN